MFSTCPVFVVDDESPHGRRLGPDEGIGARPTFRAKLRFAGKGYRSLDIVAPSIEHARSYAARRCTRSEYVESVVAR